MRYPVFIDTSGYLNLSHADRGSHPFDNESDKSQPKDSRFSHRDSELSNGSRDMRLKERIVYGDVEFPHYLWHDLDAGAWSSSVQALQSRAILVQCDN